MIGLIQRVSEAKVVVDNETVGEIQHGILLLLGVEKEDDQQKAERLFQRVSTYRIFEDDAGKMNRSLIDTDGELLVVSQFTLPANTKKGTRPSFTSAAPPELGKSMYEYFVQHAESQLGKIQTGIFAADMKIHLINDGPVTFWLNT